MSQADIDEIIKAQAKVYDSEEVNLIAKKKQAADFLSALLTAIPTYDIVEFIKPTNAAKSNRPCAFK